LTGSLKFRQQHHNTRLWRSESRKETALTSRGILFVHQNFPGQFPYIAAALVKRGDRVVAIGGPTARAQAGIELRRVVYARSSTPGILKAAVRAEADLIRAEAVARVAAELKLEGFEPAIIIGHSGWGETIHLKEVFPSSRLIVFGEYFYRSTGGDHNFDLEFETPSLDSAMHVNGKNATLGLACSLADTIVVPTPFQASSFPEAFRSRIVVHHEGIDLDRATRRCENGLLLPSGRKIGADTPVVTFISRTFERLRGFHIFMRAIPLVHAKVPEAEFVLMGQTHGTTYGAAPPSHSTWTSHMFSELSGRLDLGRIHFLGRVAHSQMIEALSISSAHVYYTYPFVLSWSLLEAMACECVIVGSDTAPVRDVIVSGVNGLLNDFFDVEALADCMVRALQRPEEFRGMRHRARSTATARFDRGNVGVPGWLKLIDGTYT
jgi:glycosyltransferase involved in cell wall biosynthesis